MSNFTSNSEYLRNSYKIWYYTWKMSKFWLESKKTVHGVHHIDLILNEAKFQNSGLFLWFSLAAVHRGPPCILHNDIIDDDLSADLSRYPSSVLQSLAPSHCFTILRFFAVSNLTNKLPRHGCQIFFGFDSYLNNLKISY